MALKCQSAIIKTQNKRKIGTQNLKLNVSQSSSFNILRRLQMLEGCTSFVHIKLIYNYIFISVLDWLIYFLKIGPVQFSSALEKKKN